MRCNIEDEPASARNLQFLLQEIDPEIEVLINLNGRDGGSRVAQSACKSL